MNLFYAWNIYKDKLPLTVALLGEACEYSVGYRLRKIEWAKDCCIKRGIVPSRNQLNQLASIRKGKLARVFSDAIEKAIEDIRKVFLYFPQ